MSRMRWYCLVLAALASHGLVALFSPLSAAADSSGGVAGPDSFTSSQARSGPAPTVEGSLFADGTGLQVEGSQGVGAGENDAPEGSEGSQVAVGGSPTVDPRPHALEPSWGQQPESGDACIRLAPRPGIDPGSELGIAWDLLTLEMMADPRLAEFSEFFCDGSPGDDTPRPHGAANAFVRSAGLPQPSITVDPGYALTGMPTYLVIGGQEAFAVSEALDGWGRLTVAFETVGFEVDWGDGTTTTVDDGRTGTPFNGDPSQHISHIYTDRDPNTEVVVEARWRATWTVGGFTGEVDGLVIEETLAVPVREFVAVRVSPDA